MSVKIMTAVFDRYPNGGGEMLLALALADHASDDGTKVYPSVAALASKTRQSVRTVQYQLRRMEEAGWLILVGHGNGGRSMASEYRISPDWIKGADIAPFPSDPKAPDSEGKKGADIAPFSEEKGAIHDTKGCNPRHKRVQPVAPANNRQEPSIEPSIKKARAQAPAPCLVQKPGDVDEQTWADWLQLRKARRAVVTQTVIDGARSEAAKADMPFSEFLKVWCLRGSQGLQASWLKPNERIVTKTPRNTNRFAGAAAAIFEDATHV